MIQGKVAALLELGAGFNPEFSGRENVFINAAIHGMSRADIQQRFDEIAEFADIGNFIDQPVKKLFFRHVCPTCICSASLYGT